MKKRKLALYCLASALAGAGITIGLLRIAPEALLKVAGAAPPPAPARQRDASDPFSMMLSMNEDFFGGIDPREEMRKLREQMGSDDLLGEGNEISEREDEKYYYVDLKLTGLEGETVKPSVEGGMLTITGERKKTKKNESGFGTSQSMVVSAFHQSFPLPQNVVPSKMEIISEPNKLVLRFPKRR